ncbi:tRNA pseudouridine(65) synthase TruC [Rheinheimera sp.]|uniref:tRNA pseudouridine(65) synthase TruC n=1 Tax=Rheinheimera sp. TaxID=1869214 RepID=UPI00307CE603
MNCSADNASNKAAVTEPLHILYRDDALIAIDKPSGLLMHRSFLDKHETEFAVQKLRDQIGQHVFPLHRLDRPTSGVLLFALSSEIARLMTTQLTARHWNKYYLTLCRGFFRAPGLLDYPLKEELDAIADKKADQDKDKQQAQTAFWPLARVELPIAVGKYQAARYSLVLAQPLTGRKHQIRRHLAHLRHPVVGCVNHGEGRHNRLFREHFDCHRLVLHAARLELTHPLTGLPLQIDAPLTDLAPLFSRLGFETDWPWYQQHMLNCQPGLAQLSALGENG